MHFDGPVTLGWRLVPGQELTYRSVVARTTERVDVSRAEEWTYLVREVDDSAIATLEGYLTAFGAGVDIDDEPVSDPQIDALRLREQGEMGPVVLRLGMDGRLHAPPLGALSTSLPHRMLALRVPASPIEPNEPWSETTLIRAFTHLFPMDLDVAVEGRCQLTSLETIDDQLLAELICNGSISTLRGSTLTLQGTSTWDADRGVLDRRIVEARLHPDVNDAIRAPGVLRMELERL